MIGKYVPGLELTYCTLDMNEYRLNFNFLPFFRSRQQRVTFMRGFSVFFLLALNWRWTSLIWLIRLIQVTIKMIFKTMSKFDLVFPRIVSPASMLTISNVQTKTNALCFRSNFGRHRQINGLPFARCSQVFSHRHRPGLRNKRWYSVLILLPKGLLYFNFFRRI